jgi:Rrf2 family protein
MDIPDQFLSKIAQQLSHARLIEVVPGYKGGMRLAVSPKKISILDVVEAVIGEIYLHDCLKSEFCNRSISCAARLVWERARKQLRATLRQATFDKLLKEDSGFDGFKVDAVVINQKNELLPQYDKKTKRGVASL